MGKSGIGQITRAALDLAEQKLSADGMLRPMLILHGLGGEAVLRFQPTSTEEHTRLVEKAELIGAAISAFACAWLFETRLLGAHNRMRRVVAVVSQSPGKNATVLARPGADGHLERLGPELKTTADADLPSPLIRFLCNARGGKRESAEAWQKLEAMGVHLFDTRRALH